MSMALKASRNEAALYLRRCEDDRYPLTLAHRLGPDAPAQLSILGNSELLAQPRTALFCSARTPGIAILRAHDAARRMRDAGVTVISGFHSQIEKDCLHILLRGNQPIVICPARALETMRISAGLRTAFDAGRVLFLSPFSEKPTRVTTDSAFRRNVVVAALADQAFLAHVSPGGQTAQIAELLQKWHVPILYAD